MYHLRLKGDHYQMGVKRGNIFQKAHISFPLQLDNFQLEHGKQSEEILRKFFPEICEEVRGVSDAIGTDYLHFISWMLCMGCCMYNLENNIPVEVRGCTAFAYSSYGRTIYGRNNDLPPYLREGSKSEIYAPKNGNRFNITTSSFINGEEGVNEHRFAVAMTFVMTDLEKIKAGFNSCFIVRYLLEKADNTEQAVSLLMGLPVSSNCNIQKTPERHIMNSYICVYNLLLILLFLHKTAPFFCLYEAVCPNSVYTNPSSFFKPLRTGSLFSFLIGFSCRTALKNRFFFDMLLL